MGFQPGFGHRPLTIDQAPTLTELMAAICAADADNELMSEEDVRVTQRKALAQPMP